MPKQPEILWEEVGNPDAPPISTAELEALQEQDTLEAEREGVYSEPSQAALAAIEGVGRGVVPFGLSTALETAVGVSPEDIRAREQYNPLTSGVSEGVGFVGGLFVPGGAAKIAEKVGRGATKAVGLGAGLASKSGLIQKMGAQAVNQAVQGAFLQSGLEAHRFFAQDPTLSVASAITNVGGVGLLSGALGSVGTAAVESPAAKKAMDYLRGVKGQVRTKAGVEAIRKKAKDLGLELPEAVQGALAEAEGGTAEVLKQSATKSGTQFRQELSSAEDDIVKSIASSLGYDEGASSVASLSEYEMGQKARSTLIEDLAERYRPVQEGYEKVQERFSKTNVLPSEKDYIVSQIGRIMIEGGHQVDKTAATYQKLRGIMKAIPRVNNLDELRRYASSAKQNLKKEGLFDLASQVGRVIQEAEEGIMTTAARKEAPELLSTLKASAKGYKELMGHVDRLNKRLRVGKYYGPKSFFTKLEEMSPETFLSRSGKLKDADMLSLISEVSPKTSESIRQSLRDRLLKKGFSAAGATSEKMNSRAFKRSYQSLEPEARNFMFSPEEQQKLASAFELLEALPANINPSGTARTTESLQNRGLLNMWSVLTGFFTGSIEAALMVKPVMQYLGKEIPDAARLAFLRNLGGAGSTTAQGFAKVSNFAHNLLQGTQNIDRAVGALGKAGVREAVTASLRPKPTELKRLRELVAEQRDLDPLRMAERQSESLGEGLENEIGAVTAATTRVVSYLSERKPKERRLSPLDPPLPPNPVEERSYERALEIAQQPLITLQRVQDGTLTAQDVIDLQNMYPELAAMLRDKVMLRAAELGDSKKPIPPRVVQSMSLFLGMPLDSSLKPEFIQSNQLSQQTQQQQPQQAPQQTLKVGQIKALEGFSNQYQTPSQAREAHDRNK